MDVMRLLGREGLAPATRATYSGALRAFFRWCTTMELREDDPMDKAPRVRVPKGGPRPITTEQMGRLLAVLNRRRTRAMVYLMVFAGLRVHEVAKLRAEDCDLQAGTLTVTGKGGKTAILPMHPELVRLAHDMPQTGPWFPTYAGGRSHIAPGSVTKVVGAAMERAGFHATAHQLRHWYGSELVARGVDLRTVQTLLRHENLGTTEIYTAVPDGARRAGVDRLELPAAA